MSTVSIFAVARPASQQVGSMSFHPQPPALRGDRLVFRLTNVSSHNEFSFDLKQKCC
eukprot:TRINITY_DN5640_c0_g1_i1.p3 TRINITY_DN5640_c0_g1~~TRINITY_DN5640_c0_g1_i1.p3  ORF type:complete len:57 (+),score=8.96 TRINITY_DN5640_c0_g1_i1:63-233(+)